MWPWASITSFRMNGTTILLQEQENGDLLYIRKWKGSNPEKKRFPVLKCPLCKKNLHPVLNASVKNDAILFDVADPRYKNIPRNHVYKCARCHHTIGIHYLNDEERKRVGLPLQHECHGKIVLA